MVRATRVAALALLAVPFVAAQDCATVNQYDVANSAGQCNVLLASGFTCAGDFAFGTQYAGYCDLSCGYNFYDSVVGPGECDGLSFMCGAELAAGGDFVGYCDFVCDYCEIPPWQGNLACWDPDYTYEACCDVDPDTGLAQTPGVADCWFDVYNFDTCFCVNPTVVSDPVCADDDAQAAELFQVDGLTCAVVAEQAACATLTDAGFPATCCASCTAAAPPPGPPTACNSIVSIGDGDTFGMPLDGEAMATNQACNWVATCDNSLAPQITFSSFDVEDSYDFVYIDSTNNGAANVELTASVVPEPVIGSSGTVSISYASDEAVNGAGFAASVSCVAPAPLPPPPPDDRTPSPPPPCQTTNNFDQSEAGACDSYLAAGTITCEADLQFGQEYAGFCNLACGIDLYDASVGAGECAGLIAGGFTCEDDFSLGNEYSGYCDFSCNFCTLPSPPPPPAGCTDDNEAAATIFGVTGLTCADVVQANACVTLADAGYAAVCCAACSAAPPPPPPSPCQDLLDTAECEDYAATGELTCEVEFSPSGEYAGYCDKTCAETTCTSECQTDKTDAAGNQWSCANAVLMGGVVSSCPFLVLEGQCANCPTCADLPATLEDDRVCLEGAMPAGIAAVQVCIDSTATTFTCEADGCQLAVADMVSHFSDCSAVDYASYDPVLGESIDSLRAIEQFCNPNACLAIYNGLFDICFDADFNPAGCEVTACDDALAAALANADTCDSPEWVADTFDSTVQEYATLLSSLRAVQCTAGCPMPDLETLCYNDAGQFACPAGGTCDTLSATFLTNLLGECGPLYRTVGYDDAFFTSMQHFHLQCTGDLQAGDYYSNYDETALLDATTTRCLALHRTAQDQCAAAGLSITSPNRCGDPSCYAAVNHLLLMNAECEAHHATVGAMWPLETASFEIMSATNDCPCMDQDLSAYGFFTSAGEVIECYQLAAIGGCHQQLRASRHLAPDTLTGADVCCESCQAADVECTDRALCSTDSPLAPVVANQLPGICDADVSSVLDGQMAGSTFAGACPVSCGSCVSFDECDSAPCQNDGTCVDHVDRYECLCTEGWIGLECDQEIPLIIPSDVFCQVQSMGFTMGTGDANDLTIACGTEYLAAQATSETRAEDAVGNPTGANSYEYFTTVVQRNTPYCPDEEETQEFIDLYVCAVGLTTGYNGTPLEAQDPGAIDAAPGENACGGQIGMDYGGNPSYTDELGNEVECGYANVVELVADSADWPAPGWYSGELTIDERMDSPLECQARCFTNAECTFFSYEWELTAGGMYHECYLKESYEDANCMVNPYVAWASEDAQWHGQSGPGIACATPVETEMACGGQIGMDYGGNPIGTDGAECGYAPVVTIFADSADWAAPGWYSGPLVLDASMISPLQCQARCFATAECDFFSYEWELTAGGMYHECYLKSGYAEERCSSQPYVTWASQDAQWHGQSGPGIACSSPTELELACGGQIGMDYGGNPIGTDGVECGYAPVIAIFADSADWAAPGWYDGPVVIDETMASPLDCQARCFLSDQCDFFSYEWELTAGGMYHECYMKSSYAEERCSSQPYVPWASEDAQWHGQSGPGIACATPVETEMACGGQIGMDYGGNPIGTDGAECGYAPVVTIFADSADWAAPGWYSGPLVRDASMISPLQCQARCFATAECDFFSYEWELTAGGMYHECYLKSGYAEERCSSQPYVPWASEDAQWHGQSGPGIACASAADLEPACEGFIGMDYGGNPIGTDGVECGYAPVIAIFADSADWHAPGWYDGPLVIDENMSGPRECQQRCFLSALCDFFSYEWELTAGGMYHECYLKVGYAEARCSAQPYVPWASQDPQWHGQSGPGIACVDDGLVCDQNPCVGDVNRDNAVNTADLLLVLSVFGRQSCDVDIVQTTAWPGLVNTDDLLALLAAFGDTC